MDSVASFPKVPDQNQHVVQAEPITMQSSYPKPKTFSDPGRDWHGYESVFQDMAARDPDDLTPREFGMIFAPILPAADYEEGAYYLDACFRNMSRRDNVVEGNLCSGVFWFIDHHKERLGKDGLLSLCLELIADLWRTYTSDFDLMRLTDQELEQYGIREDYRQFVKHSRTVHDLVDALIEHELYGAVLDDLLTSLDDGSTVDSCWWMEIAYHARWWYVIHHRGSEENARRQHILHRLLALEVYLGHERRARNYVCDLHFNEYYRRVSIV